MSQEGPNSEERQSDEDFASDIQDFRSLLRNRDQDGLISALENPDLYRLACDDPRYAEIAMQGISVLAWSVPAKASEFLVRFDEDRARENPASSARRAARALMAALEWRQLEAVPASPLASAEFLRDFLRFYSALADQGEHAQRLRDDLQKRPAYYADLLAYLDQHAQILPRWIFNLVHQGRAEEVQLDEAGYALAPELSDSQRRAVLAAISELRVSLRTKLPHYLLWAAAVALVIALPSALGALLGLLLLGLSFALGEGKSYETILRPRLVRLAMDHGVGAKQLVTTIYQLRSEAGKVGNFDIKIQNDHALDLLAALSSALSPATPSSDAPASSRLGERLSSSEQAGENS